MRGSVCQLRRDCLVLGGQKQGLLGTSDTARSQVSGRPVRYWDAIENIKTRVTSHSQLTSGSWPPLIPFAA